MTSGCLAWLRTILAEHPEIAGPVLELGSLDVNGSVRELFADLRRFPSFTGLDLVRGVSVDIQARADALPLASGACAVLVSVEMLEHDSRFWLSLLEMRRVLTAGGTVLLTTRGLEFPKHHEPDYWRFTAAGLATALQWAGFDDVDAVEDVNDGGVYAMARLTPDAPPRPYGRAPSARLEQAQIDVLRRRSRALTAMGLTWVEDAVERLLHDLSVLESALRDVERAVPLDDTPCEIRSRMRRLIGHKEEGA